MEKQEKGLVRKETSEMGGGGATKWAGRDVTEEEKG